MNTNSNRYITAVYGAADRTRVTPFLDGLAERYSLFSYALPLADCDGATIAETLRRAAVSILFFSKNSDESGELRRIIDHLLADDMPILVVYLDEVTLSPGLQFLLSLCPVFYPNRHETLASAVETLKNAPFLKAALE